MAYPDRPLNRLSSAFRIITVIPILIVLALFTTEAGNHRVRKLLLHLCACRRALVQHHDAGDAFALDLVRDADGRHFPHLAGGGEQRLDL